MPSYFRLKKQFGVIFYKQKWCICLFVPFCPFSMLKGRKGKSQMKFPWCHWFWYTVLVMCVFYLWKLFLYTLAIFFFFGEGVWCLSQEIPTSCNQGPATQASPSWSHQQFNTLDYHYHKWLFSMPMTTHDHNYCHDTMHHLWQWQLWPNAANRYQPQPLALSPGIFCFTNNYPGY